MMSNNDNQSKEKPQEAPKEDDKKVSASEPEVEKEKLKPGNLGIKNKS